MTTPASTPGADRIVQDYDLDAPPQKVWRAISIPELRAHWLPAADLAAAEPASVTPGREVSYRMREQAPPFAESLVTFTIAPNTTGGTRLRVVHRRVAAANDRSGPLMRAA